MSRFLSGAVAGAIVSTGFYYGFSNLISSRSFSFSYFYYIHSTLTRSKQHTAEYVLFNQSHPQYSSLPAFTTLVFASTKRQPFLHLQLVVQPLEYNTTLSPPSSTRNGMSSWQTHIPGFAKQVVGQQILHPIPHHIRRVVKIIIYTLHIHIPCTIIIPGNLADIHHILGDILGMDFVRVVEEVAYHTGGRALLAELHRAGNYWEGVAAASSLPDLASRDSHMDHFE